MAQYCEGQRKYEDVATHHIVKPYPTQERLCLQGDAACRFGCQEVVSGHIQSQTHDAEHQQACGMDSQQTGQMSE